MDKILSASVAVMDPDVKMFERMWTSMRKYAPELNAVVIVDNGNDDNEYSVPLDGPVAMSVCEFYAAGRKYSAKEFVTEKLYVAILYAETNNGFGISHNDALAYLKASGMLCKYHAVLNDDIEFFALWAEPMLEKLENSVDDLDLLTTAQVGLMNGTCNKIDFLGNAWGEYTPNPDYCEGSCFVVNTGFITEQNPLFSGKYKMGYYEDTDLSFRIRAAGLNVSAVCVPWVHHRAVTSRKAKEVDMRGHQENNRYEFHKEWSGFLAKGKKVPFYVIRRTGSIGDVFLATAVAKELKDREDCVVGIATSCPQLVTTSPVVDVVFPDPYDPFTCTRLIDLDNAYETDFTRSIVERYMQKAELECRGYPSQRTGIVGVRKENVDKVQSLLKRAVRKHSKLVAIDVSDSWQGKQWNYNYYVDLARLLSKEADVVVIGHRGNYIESRYPECCLDLVNRLDVLDTVALLSMMNLYVGHEGMLLHVAQALRELPHVGLYGCTTPELVNDIELKTWHGVVAKTECRGCRHRHAAGNRIRCKRNYECMETIKVEEVFNKCLEAIQ